MTQTPATGNPEAANLKATRRAAAKPGTTPPLADVPVSVGVSEPPRRFPMLFDPNEPRQIAPPGGVTDGYVVAPEDVYEQVTPIGCITPTERMRWAKGQRVPVETFRAYEAELAAKAAEA